MLLKGIALNPMAQPTLLDIPWAMCWGEGIFSFLSRAGDRPIIDANGELLSYKK